MSHHVAVVPISVVDAHTAGALDYAGSLTSRVIALHVRGPGGSPEIDVEQLWRAAGNDLPMVIVDAPEGDGVSMWRCVLAALERSEQPEQITIVLPWHPTGGRDDALRIEELMAASAEQPGVVIHHAPAPG